MVRIKIAKQALKIRGLKPRQIAGAKFRSQLIMMTGFYLGRRER